jgi:hypothetical protein
MNKIKNENINYQLITPISTISTSSSILNPTINYVTDGVNNSKKTENPYYNGDATALYSYKSDENNVTLPIFFGHSNTLQIPKGIKKRVKRLPKKLLNKIDKNTDVSVEKCLIFISSLTYTVFNDDDDYWKGLSSTIMNDLFKKGKDNTYIYINIIKALTYTTNSTQSIIECKKNELGNDSYQENNYTKKYRLHTSAVNLNLVSYNIFDRENILKRRKKELNDLVKAKNNVIGRNLISVYQFITLPIKEDIFKYGKKLAKQKHKTKKGKLLTCLNKKPKTYYSNSKERSFVEENIKQYDYLVGLKYIIPKVGDYKSGGRVVDSFNLMSSWIRSLIKIDGEKIVELDFKGLHPNLAINIYDGKTKYITHEKIAKDLNLPLREVKIEHLSFFNKRVCDLKKSPLYSFYLDNEEVMINNLINDKNQFGYKKTSQRLFKKEVEIMTSIIKKLNSIDIYVLYVYDALYCKESDKNTVTEIMNSTILEHNVYTNIG